MLAGSQARRTEMIHHCDGDVWSKGSRCVWIRLWFSASTFSLALHCEYARYYPKITFLSWKKKYQHIGRDVILEIKKSERLLQVQEVKWERRDQTNTVLVFLLQKLEVAARILCWKRAYIWHVHHVHHLSVNANISTKQKYTKMPILPFLKPWLKKITFSDIEI